MYLWKKKTLARTFAVVLCSVGLSWGMIAATTQSVMYKSNEKIIERAIQTARKPRVLQPPNNTASIHPADSGEDDPILSNDTSVSSNASIRWLSSVNMEELRRINPDVIGWILLPDTDISQPLLQTTGNQYYLEHSWDGSENVCGAIYMDYRSALEDWNAVIYGHNMKNGSMFARIRGYQDSEFAKEHSSLYILCDDEIREYTFSAAFEAELDGVPYTFGSMDDASKCLFSGELTRKTGKEIPGPTVTLSTCTGRGHQTRWVAMFSLTAQRNVV